MENFETTFFNTWQSWELAVPAKPFRDWRKPTRVSVGSPNFFAELLQNCVGMSGYPSTLECCSNCREIGALALSNQKRN